VADRIIAIRLNEKEPGLFRVLLLEPVIASAELKIRRSGYRERQLHPGTRFEGGWEGLVPLIQEGLTASTPKKAVAPEDGSSTAVPAKGRRPAAPVQDALTASAPKRTVAPEEGGPTPAPTKGRPAASPRASRASRPAA
jgi:hypothetical protein